jgi:putative ABC transport system permease protein
MPWAWKLFPARNFTEGDFKKVKADTLFSFIVNESALQALFIAPEEAIGTKARVSGREGEIVGVVRTFISTHFTNPLDHW